MSIQQYFTRFHKEIKVETEELREKRDILVEKIRASLKKAGQPLPVALNQGSYIYGVGVKPLGDIEYDIDVGLDFPIQAFDYEAKTVRKWVYDAIADHTKNVEDRGPCIRVRYAAGYHVDLVVYARFKDQDDVENYQLAHKDGSWKPAEPKKLKDYISDARKPFVGTKDSSGSDQLQRLTRYLKRWNDIDIPDDSPDKPFGLATLLLVINKLNTPFLDQNGDSNDLEALIAVACAVKNTYGRVSIRKPTQEFEDVFAKLSDKAMERLKSRFGSLLSDLESARYKSDDDAAKILRRQFGSDFPESLRKFEDSSTDSRVHAIRDMEAAAPAFINPSKPWCRW
ncbi:MAG TPA: hypothetical protein DCS07_09965 [Bdellovibrionales bacterium]|nr:MAG: hypothetical protein A2Z97_04410 [Bdellovibrionales bacterium GWB1_52_6]OFZ02722.1 MAG: hypothetical protein A2X97_12325 [Bdellovibrionales bacterium GWA1_52_35]OFZ39748.1 MAG: hypothetical protein A2070_00975 [Bdellovibrionales bacterium GWC1_52_8]HAR42938.1 hypothetical protein [Bdellovibrionales bacterium]HCM41620.1 hypothetical protein [Bdellovibrionales bacterium]